MSATPRTNDAWDAYGRKACGLAYLRHQMQALERELEELKAWRAGQKGIEDYYIIKEKLYVAETSADAWRKCAERLARIVAADETQFHLADDIEPALSEFENMKGKR